MQRIDKGNILALVYKDWIDKIESNNEDHPEYSSKHEFYLDIVANLLWVQKGLCAYTEMMLFDPADLSADKWVNGRFGGKFKFFGHLEHYDESLKKTKGYLWSNLFVAHSDVNTKNKGSKKVNYVLKPDLDNYDPFFLLQYDFRSHHFFPNADRDEDLQIKILEDINVLGLNFQPVVQQRRKKLTSLIESVRLRQKTLIEAKAELFEFYTSFEMSLRALSLI
ncbi:MAG: hypothetical protein JWQ09_4706 [Segetibacter sp.]|nr:hypothetical protein [Segetibacter sp.]